MPPEVRKLRRTLRAWYPQVLAYHQGHHSNGITEAMNNLIKRIKRVGYGFRNFNNYRTRVLLYAGKPHWRTSGSTTIPHPHQRLPTKNTRNLRNHDAQHQHQKTEL